MVSENQAHISLHVLKTIVYYLKKLGPIFTKMLLYYMTEYHMGFTV